MPLAVREAVTLVLRLALLVEEGDGERVDEGVPVPVLLQEALLVALPVVLLVAVQEAVGVGEEEEDEVGVPLVVGVGVCDAEGEGEGEGEGESDDEGDGDGDGDGLTAMHAVRVASACMP